MPGGKQTARKKVRAEPYLTALSVKGFKSLRDEARVEIRPLTILAGANSAGKSSIIQPLLLLKQTLEAQYDPGPLLLDGPNVRFTEARQLFWTFGQQEPRRFSVSLELSGQPALVLTFDVGGDGKIRLHTQELKWFGVETLLRSEDEGTSVMKSLPKPWRKVFTDVGFTDAIVRRRRCLIMLVLRGSEPSAGASEVLPNVEAEWPPFALFPLPDVVQGLIHLPGHRGNPQRTYKLAGVGDTFPGQFQDYVATLIAQWKDTDKQRFGQLCKSLKTLGLTWKVHLKAVDDTQVELQVGRLPSPRRGGARDLVNIADVGFGVSQSLPVLAALVAAERDQLVYLEQPEIHLHPRAQVALASLLADAAKRGVRLIVETHSSLLLRAVQTLVAKEILSPEIVKLYWFARDSDGATQVVGAELDEDGAFGEWPEDFGAVELQVEQEYLDTVTQRGQ